MGEFSTRDGLKTWMHDLPQRKYGNPNFFHLRRIDERPFPNGSLFAHLFFSLLRVPFVG
jgi:hypothetical protein